MFLKKFKKKFKYFYLALFCSIILFPSFLIIIVSIKKEKKHFRISKLFGRQLPFFESDEEKLNEIRAEMLHAWNGYKKYCWGQGQLSSLQPSCDNYFPALTLIDSLPTLYAMRLYDEFNQSRDYMKYNYTLKGSWSTFEIIIRILGGLLSAYQLSNDDIFLNRSIELADAILPLINKTTGKYLISSSIYTINGTHYVQSSSSSLSSIAESGTIQLEFLTLAMLTGNKKYMKAATAYYHDQWSTTPQYVFSTYNNERPRVMSFGGHLDSYFEYIIKTYIMTGQTSPKILDRYLLVVEELRSCLFTSNRTNITTIGKRIVDNVTHYVTHLSTFVGGMLALGAVDGNPLAVEDLILADNLTVGFYNIYQYFKAGIGPDSMMFNDDNLSKEAITPLEDEYYLRPETVESIYVMYKLTGNPKFRKYAWNIFLSIRKYCKTKYGYAGIGDVRRPNQFPLPEQQSWFLAETLHYLYLTFESSSFMPLDEWVYNTEAHPLKIWDKETAKKWSEYLQFEEVPFQHNITYNFN